MKGRLITGDGTCGNVSYLNYWLGGSRGYLCINTCALFTISVWNSAHCSGEKIPIIIDLLIPMLLLLCALLHPAKSNFHKDSSLFSCMLLSHSWNAKPNTIHLALFKNEVLINIIQSTRCLLLQDSESLFSLNSSVDSQFMYFQWSLCSLSTIVGLGRFWLQFAGVVMWAHGMIINPLQSGTSKQAIMLGAAVSVPATGLSCLHRECHSRWWFNSSSRRRPPVSMGVSVWTVMLAEWL